MEKLIHKAKKHRFMFEELVKRDFKKKYQGTVLGMGWSILSPLMHLLVMRLVFTQFFGRNTPFYTTYLFAGNVMFSYFKDATRGGMNALVSNASIFTKVNVPKYMFLLSRNVSAVINFGLTLMVFFLFAALDGVTFSVKFFAVIYPVVYLVVFNIGMGLILSALFVYFRDTEYLYDIFTTLLHYMSAIFYSVDGYSPVIQNVFLLNPVYCAIKYMRQVVINGQIPSAGLHLLMLFYASAVLLIGGYIYKKRNHEFLYYV